MAEEKKLIRYEDVYQYAFDGVHGGGLEAEEFDAIVNAIDSVDAVDAVEVPQMGYCCGEYFVYGEDPKCPYCGHAFTEMHSSELLEIEAWNRRAQLGRLEIR